MEKKKESHHLESRPRLVEPTKKWENFSMKIICVPLLLFVILGSSFAIAQQEQNVQTGAIYRTDIDDLLTVKSISVLPTTDNVSGIYSRALEEELKNLVNKGHRFQLVDSQFAGALISPDDLESNPQQVKDISQNINADAVLASRVLKAPDGIHIQMSLFSKADGKLLSKENLKEKSSFDIKQIRTSASEMYSKLIKQLPYDGIVLSRNNALVTINLGKRDGLAAGQVVSASLVIKANRHPKLNFIISTDKEVLGKIRLDKVDDTISFGQILSEKSPGAIRKNSKISGIDFTKYSPTPLNGAFQSPAASPNSSPTFGDNPKEWRPADPPTFGKVGAFMGLGSMNYNAKKEDGTTEKESSSLYPSVKLMAELWFTSEWIGNFELEQGILDKHNQSNYQLSFGYNFMIQDDFFGPSILLSLGFASHGLDMDSSSTSLSSTRYTGFFFGIRGTVPVTDDKKWNLGGDLKFFLSSDLNESPTSSGSSDNTMTKFSIIGYYQQNTKLRFVGSLNFALFSSKFDGTPQPNDSIDSSQKFTTLNGGIEYLF